MSHSFLITTAFGLEDLLVSETKQVTGVEECKQRPGQVSFQGSLPSAYKMCLWSRLANRVLLKLEAGKVEQVQDLYDLAMSVAWVKHFTASNTFAVDFFGTNRLIKNTQFGAVKVKDAIVDQFNQQQGSRPNVDKKAPDLRVHVRLHRDVATLYLDLSGASLHQRHYRQVTGSAPIRENLAYAMLWRSGWLSEPTKPLLDPMCGSGTVVIEAALYAANVAPGLKRTNWGFSQWLQHDNSAWQNLLQQAHEAIKKPEGKILATDIDHVLVDRARQNASNAGVQDLIQFQVKDATHLVPDAGQPGYLVCNPPYGERLGELTSLIPLFQAWGHQLKQRFAGWQLALLTSNRDLFRQLRLVSSKSYKLKNANLDCELVLFSMDARNCQVIESDHGQQNDFANRLKKNINKLKSWLKRQDTDCYRVYDADLPEYNVAIDRYADWVVVQEYAAPKNIPQHKTIRRLHEILSVLPSIMQVEPEKIVLKVREIKKGKSQYEKVGAEASFLTVHENGAKFRVNLHDYLDTGLFLDHRDTRKRVRDLSKGKRVLNLFAYTGSVSVFAALGGAKSVTTVDMSNTYLEWAKKNFKLNKLNYGYHFIKADCSTWLQRHKDKYDLIFIDPPSFSNSKSMEGTWDVQRDHVALLKQARQCLAPGGSIIFSNNYRGFKLAEGLDKTLDMAIENISSATIPEDFKRNQKIHHCWLLTAPV